MEPFIKLEAVAAPIDESNIDTDRIIPARFLRKPRSMGFGGFVFHDERIQSDGSERSEFVLNQPAFRKAQILVTDANFGCGSSREGAVWALVDSGVRSVIAPSFGDIFFNNACKNGLLPVRLPSDTVAGIRAQLHRSPGARITVDLETQTVTDPSGTVCSFAINSFQKECLLKGFDDIDLTLQHEAEIATFVERRRQQVPWLFLD